MDSPSEPVTRPRLTDFKQVEGYYENFELPLRADGKSLETVNAILENTKLGRTEPYGQVLFSLTGRNVRGRNAMKHWRYILAHKSGLEQRIGRTIGIRAAAIDYFDVIGDEEKFLQTMQNKPSETGKSEEEDWLTYVFSSKSFSHRLQEEIQRAKRYRHALSLILTDVDHFGAINEKHGVMLGDMVLTRTVKIIKKSIRTVDILSRVSGDQFAVILPHANKREAQELAERVRKNVEDRSKYIKELPGGFTITLSVVQYKSEDTSSNDLSRRAKSLLEAGKDRQRNFVHVEA